MFSRFISTLSAYGKRPEFFAFWAVVGFGLFGLVLSLVAAGPFRIPFVVGAFIGVCAAAFSLSIRLVEARGREGLREREVATLIQGLKDGVVMYDPDFKIRSMNSAMENLTGVTGTEVSGVRIDPGFVKNPHFRVLSQIMFPSLAPSVVQISETSAWPQVVSLTLDEPPLELTLTLHRMSDVSGRLLGFLKIIEDRTHEKSVVRSKDDFISVAAHQLRTPLTAISWAAQNLSGLHENLSPEATNLVAQISDLADRASRITNDLLDASKIEEGRFGYTFEEIDLVSFVARLAKEVAVLAKEYRVQVLFERPADPSMMVTVDTARISTVLTNLLDNAIRYNTENGKVTVSLIPLENAPFVKVQVSDTGIGVPRDESGKLFQKLERGSNAIHIEPNGTGLGLYIAKNIVRRHGGDMGFESIEGRGSSFWFTLPRDPSLIPPRES